ncbi:MAG: DUF2842 domain-containing protein [Asticcacaulis sp.]
MEQQTQSHPNLALRRAVASVGIVVFLCLYVVGVSNLGRHIPPHNVLLTLVYYALAGTLWGVPVLPLITWSGAGKRLKPQE